MKQSIKLIMHTTKVFVLFVGFTILFYFGMVWLNQEYENYHRYDEPNGTAIKASATVEEEGNWIDRLKLFYMSGE
ncbi:YqzK family protein [Peribacillus acanthi]|uniref:YqzK family protein n=1 Tax=Peribacillus acanthi TaxID=2171554 RepID=UPI000D3ECD1A|nr:YqzK family protein [Peribacillus acanthi]